MWYREHIGGDRTPIVDTWWQTETGMIADHAAARGDDGRSRGRRRSRSRASTPPIYDEQGNEVGPGGGGYLVLRRPWPAMLRGI